MLFNSLEFLVFYIVVTVLFFTLPHKYRWLHLLLASCYFYAAFVPVYILILLFTIVIDYYAGIYIEKATLHKKRYLIISLIANIGILAIFKYFNFFIGNINTISHFFGSEMSLPLLKIILPIGLSFHTFQAMSYTIEVYRGNQKAEKHFGIYALYVMFYPQLVAGPIERPQNVLHQFHEVKVFSSENLWFGLRLMLWGLFKKVVIADRLSIFVDAVFDAPSEYNALQLVIGAIFFSVQIYCDFSGYSDMAIGAAKTMGYNLMINFNRPYFATNIKQFWDRWHISLSTWFRDYVYIPLGGNRVGNSRLFLNFAIVFLLSGFWHGANWTFILWGALHAVYVLMNMLIQKKYNWFNLNQFKLYKPLAWIVTFILVAFAWIFFRASSLSNALDYISCLFFNNNEKYSISIIDIKDGSLELIFGMRSYIIVLFSLLILFFIELKLSPVFSEKLRFRNDILFCGFILLLVMFFGVFQKETFIYFQF